MLGKKPGTTLTSLNEEGAAANQNYGAAQEQAGHRISSAAQIRLTIPAFDRDFLDRLAAKRAGFFV